MPPRKAATAARKPAERQTTLNFRSKISKANAVPPHKKESASPAPSAPQDRAASASPEPETKPEPEPESRPEPEVEPEHVPEPPLAPEEEAARKVTEKQLKQFHKEVLTSRSHEPVHQGDLSLDEKILRYFDMSSQYGPCIGMSRLRRWKRAHTLGLEPPIEVLAVCMKVEEEKGGKEKLRDTRLAYIDESLSTKTVEE